MISGSAIDDVDLIVYDRYNSIATSDFMEVNIMALTIGQVGRLLNLTPETIRYYENEGVLNPQRKEGSTYRAYEIWDVFDLFECLKYRNMNFSIKETKGMMKEYGLDRIEDSFSKQITVLRKQIIGEQIMLQSLSEYFEKIRNARMNIGNYWFKTEDEKISIQCTARSEKDYVDFDYKNETLVKWIQNNPFLRTYLQTSLDDYFAENDANIWLSLMKTEHFEMMDLPSDGAQIIPSKLYLHTMIDMGGRGEMSLRLLDPVVEYVKSKDLEVDGNILGELLIRYYEDEKWHRLVEVMVPIKK